MEKFNDEKNKNQINFVEGNSSCNFNKYDNLAINNMNNNNYPLYKNNTFQNVNSYNNNYYDYNRFCYPNFINKKRNNFYPNKFDNNFNHVINSICNNHTNFNNIYNSNNNYSKFSKNNKFDDNLNNNLIHTSYYYNPNCANNINNYENQEYYNRTADNDYNCGNINNNRKNNKRKNKKKAKNMKIKNENNIIDFDINPKKFDKIINKFFKLYDKIKVSVGELELINEFKDELTINLKNKIFEILDIKDKDINDEFFYAKILKIIRSMIDKGKNEQITLKFLDALCLYITNKIISINNYEDIKNKAFEFLTKSIKSISKLGMLYEKYILCFNIKEKLSEHLKNKENLLNFKTNSIFLINFFNLQNIVSLKEYILIINDNRLDHNLINYLFHTYNRTEEELLDLYNFIISKVPKNSLPFTELERIFDNNCFKEEYKKLLIDNLLKPIKEKSDKYYSLYYNFIYKNDLDKYFPESKEPKFLYDLIFTLKFFNTALTLIKFFNEEKIKSLDKSLLKELLYSIDCEDTNSIAFLLEYLPEEFDKIVNKYMIEENKKGLLKLVKKINIKEKSNNKIIKNIEETNINNFYLWKIKACFKTQFDLIVEYIKNQKEFDVFFRLVIKKIKKDINKLSCVLNCAKRKNFTIPKIINDNLKLLIKEAEKENNDMSFTEDKFGPRTEGCISYSINEINVIFIQNINDLINNYELYLKNSKYIGIDTEWRDSLSLDTRTQTAIMQLSDYDGKNCLILDVIELIKEEKFEDIFENLFIKNIFISFGFKDDLETLPDKLIPFFKEKVRIIDITHLYKIKYLDECPSLSKLCNKIFGKPLCKYEQCSNWERRPLRKSQLHYAALDSIFCCLIFKKLIEKNN